MSVYRNGTTIVEAIFDSWSRNLPLLQVKQECEEHFGHGVPLLLVKEMYRLYDIEYYMNMCLRSLDKPEEV